MGKILWIKFHLLPLEIRFEIVCLLPTIEYLNLRLASKAMVHIFYSQKYWKSRFLIHRKRRYLNYLLEEDSNLPSLARLAVDASLH